MRQGQYGPELLMQDSADKKELDLPGGTSEDEETPQATARRETLKKTGLTVDAAEMLGETLQSHRDEGETLITTYLFAAQVTDGNLRTSDETTRFRWVSREKLADLVVAGTPCPEHPRGHTYEMAERALKHGSPVLSTVNDPYNLAVVA